MEWSQIFQCISTLSVIGVLITAYISVKKYQYEKNRELYVKRLSEVYAPLYELIIKQETFRETMMPTIKYNEVPIISLETIKTKTTYKNDTGEITVQNEDVPFEEQLLHRLKFIKKKNEVNLGLCTPELLVKLNEYETLIYLEETTKDDQELFEKATTQKVEVELQLLKEIESGYFETIELLEIRGKKKSEDGEDDSNPIFLNIMRILIFLYFIFAIKYVLDYKLPVKNEFTDRMFGAAGFVFTILGTWYAVKSKYKK